MAFGVGERKWGYFFLLPMVISAERDVRLCSNLAEAAGTCDELAGITDVLRHQAGRFACYLAVSHPLSSTHHCCTFMKKSTCFLFFVLFVPAFFLAQSGGAASKCEKDSTLLYNYSDFAGQSPLEERILYQYLPESMVQHRFRRLNGAGPLVAFGGDSVALDAAHRPAFREVTDKTFGPDPIVVTQWRYYPCPLSGPCLADSVLYRSAPVPILLDIFERCLIFTVLRG